MLLPWTDILMVVILTVLTVLVGLLVRALNISNGHLETKLQELVESIVAQAIARQDDRIEKRIRRHPETETGQAEQTPGPRVLWESGMSISDEELRKRGL